MLNTTKPLPNVPDSIESVDKKIYHAPHLMRHGNIRKKTHTNPAGVGGIPDGGTGAQYTDS